MNIKINILYNENGFTLTEVIIASFILSIISIPIFYSCFQSSKNLISAQTYYETTLDSQNILVVLKNYLDENYNNELILNVDCNLENLLSDLDLNLEKYKYELYIYNSTNNLIFNYIYPFEKEKNNSPKIKFQSDNNFIYDDLSNLTELDIQDLIINNKDISIDSAINLKCQPLSVDIKNYKNQNIELNIYSNKSQEYSNNLKLQSFAQSGSIKVNYYNNLSVNDKVYILLILTKDKSTQKVLHQLIDLYSFISN